MFERFGILSGLSSDNPLVVVVGWGATDSLSACYSAFPFYSQTVCVPLMPFIISLVQFFTFCRRLCV